MKLLSSKPDLGRRRFTLSAAAGTVAIVVGGCGESSGDDGSGGTEGDAGSGGSGGESGSGEGSSGGLESSTGPTTTQPTTDGTTGGPGAPVWMTVPTIQFIQGVASEVSVAEFVSDPDGDELALMLNDVELPSGVTFDAAGMRFAYDGTGPVGMSSGHVLTADDATD